MGVVAAVSVLGFLLVIAEIINKPDGVSIGWALYVVIVLTFLQAAVAIGALLLDAGIISAPAPRPKYEQQQYGQYGGPGQYYGQPPAAPARSSPAAPSGISVAVRRLPGWIVLRRILRAASRAARRPRRPASRPTASRRHPSPRQTGQGPGTVAAVEFVESVRQLAVIVRASRA